ncbi:N-acetylneuraminic acid outer membrane channel protein NanC [Vibrio maritimus]|uniref:N-acetylneuraminic acid outer membrane channel protein NanC n=1 Tax=Vibrio maritimus TaxID=990268 RepID=A0A090SM26_9VIBR|nr:N-acetylneuraminic acid outer membrane channel protein NanC [Vibrio maritimus]
MSTLNKVTVALVSVFATAAVSAASFDVRTEYKHTSKEHATRVKMGDSIGNFYYSGELKFKGEEGAFLKDLQNNGWELDLGYRFKLNDNWTIQPGMPIEARSKGMTYKPQLRVTYALDSVEGLSLSGRYRYDIRQNNGEDAQNERRHRITANLNYSLNEWRFGLEGNYYKADTDGYILYNNKDTNYELNATARRHFGQWAPYVEFGDVNVDSTTDRRELRSRVGVTYSF